MHLGCKQVFFECFVCGSTRKFALFYGKTSKIIPKRIVCYSIGTHSAEISTNVFTKLQHKLSNFNFIEQFLFINRQISLLLNNCRFYGL